MAPRKRGQPKKAASHSSQTMDSDSSRSGTSSDTSNRRRTRAADNDVPNKLQYTFKSVYTEDHKSPIFCIQFNHFVKDVSVFACCGSNRVSIYECLLDGNLKSLQCYADLDGKTSTDHSSKTWKFVLKGLNAEGRGSRYKKNDKEQFYTCAWSYTDNTCEPMLAAAGARGVIRILQMKDMTCSRTIPGHGGEIYEVKFHPKDCNLLLTASRDRSIRLWNVKTAVCIAIFAGDGGHRDAVLSVDFNMEGDQFVSCGIDHAVKFWFLDKEEIEGVIAKSRNFDINRSLTSFPTHLEAFPDFSTRKVHYSYVDCVRWFGNLLISKTNHKTGSLKFWVLDCIGSDANIELYHEIECENCNLWFLKFSMDATQKTVALGNKKGKIFVWNLNVTDPELMPCTVLTHARCTRTVRHTALNRDGMILIAGGDDGTIWRYDQTLV